MSYELTAISDAENGSLTKTLSKDSLKQDIQWNNLSFDVETPAGKKSILQSCSGSVKAGETCAILGPSGAGKSSLLNVLAGRSAPAPGITISGDVKVGGKSINPVAFRRNIAYVMQDDSLMATSTPRESIEFSARLRLPPSTTNDEIKKLTEKLLKDLGILECADVMIGGAMIKGISGGQRKRTSVGVEVITQPTLLFLDEPTSGLDAFSAHQMVTLLKKLAGDQTAVLCTIHQPSSEVFFLFDNVIFMKEGQIFYQGPANAAQDYFTKLNMPCPSNHNIADHIMNLCQTLSNDECNNKNIYSDNNKAITDTNDNNNSNISGNGNDEIVDFIPQPSATMWLQLSALLDREIKNVIRDKGALIGRFGITIFLNLLFGIIFWGVGSTDQGDVTNFQNHFGAITMVTISSMFGSAQPVMLMFPFERPMFMREYSTGTYSATSYFIIKTCIDLPLTLATCVVQYLLCYFMLDLQGSFFYMVLAAWGLGVGAASSGMMIGCAVTDVKTVSEFAPVLFVPQLLFAGFFIATERIPLILRWAQWLCGIKYAINLILLTEFDGDLDSCNSSPQAAINCKRALTTNSVDADDAWIYILALALIFAIFRILAVLILVQKSKRFY